MATKQDIAQILTILRAAIPRQQISRAQFKEMITTWTAVLGDLPAEALRLAVYERISGDTPWFPTPGQIRQRAFDLTKPLAHTITPLEAWAEVKRALAMGQHRFTTGQERWSSPIVQHTFECIGGWAYFRHALVSTEMSDRARFLEAFEQLQDRDIQQHRALPQVHQYRQIMAAKRDQLPRPQADQERNGPRQDAGAPPMPQRMPRDSDGRASQILALRLDSSDPELPQETDRPDVSTVGSSGPEPPAGTARPSPESS